MYDFPGRAGIEKLTQLIKGKLANVATSGSYSDLSDKPTISNPNLLINPDFKINQREITSYDFGTLPPIIEGYPPVYTVDRWKLVNGSFSINTLDDEKVFYLNGTLIQILENHIGTNFTVTIDVMTGEATASYDDETQTFTIEGKKAIINWAKLEIGSTATPYSPPDTATELMKCKRYYQRISGAYRQIANGFIQSSGIAMTCSPLQQQMRIAEVTLNFVGKVYIWYKGHIASGGAESTTIITPINLSQNLATLGFNLNSAVDASYIGMPCLVQLRDSDSYIEFDAEL